MWPGRLVPLADGGYTLHVLVSRRDLGRAVAHASRHMLGRDAQGMQARASTPVFSGCLPRPRCRAAKRRVSGSLLLLTTIWDRIADMQAGAGRSESSSGAAPISSPAGGSSAANAYCKLPLRLDTGLALVETTPSRSPKRSPVSPQSPSPMGAAATAAASAASLRQSRQVPASQPVASDDAAAAGAASDAQARGVGRQVVVAQDRHGAGTKITMVSLDCGLGVHSALPCTRERARHIAAWLQACAFPQGVTAARGLLDLVVLQGVHTEVAQHELIKGISRSLDLRHLLTAVGTRSMGCGCPRMSSVVRAMPQLSYWPGRWWSPLKCH